MIHAVFISDLHLHPDEPDSLNRFNAWVDWAVTHTRAVYILGDFFHAWAGDDTLDAWSGLIAVKLASLSQQGVSVYFMHGNRDFLLGKRFAAQAGMHLLTEPAFITLGSKRIMLVHGDRYCTNDTAHQRFRRLTRNRLFVTLFLWLPRRFRVGVVARVRKHSRGNRPAESAIMDVVPSALMHHARQCNADVVIHGHTHKPEITTHTDKERSFQHIVLSDWEATPSILCYNEPKGFYFNL